MENRLLSFARLAIAVARRTVPRRGNKFAPSGYTQPQLLACLLLKEHLRLDYRGVEALLGVSGALRRALGLRHPPDHSTLCRFAHRLAPAHLQTSLAETVCRVDAGSAPAVVALDSTGLWLSHSSRYFRWRAKRERGQRGWLKWALALWAGPQGLVAQKVGRGPSGDFPDLVPLASAANAVLPFDQLVADAGYDSEANHRFCREALGIDSLIPAKKRRSVAVIATTPYRQEMVERFGLPGDPEARRTYGQRWKAETVMSVAKRKWGEALTARSEATQAIQALLRGVVYNLHRLVTLKAIP